MSFVIAFAARFAKLFLIEPNKNSRLKFKTVVRFCINSEVKMEGLNLKKLFLYSLIVSVSLSALIGIGVILLRNFGDFEGKVLATTFTIACTSILGLACGAYLETKRGKILPTFGIVFSIISAIMFFFLIWADRVFDNETFLKTLGSITMSAVACSHLSLISIAKLDAKFQWSKIALTVCVWVLVSILLYLMWFQPNADSEFIVRFIAVLSIIITSLTIVTPIFYKLSTGLPKAEEIDAEINRLKTRIIELEQQKAEIVS
jgi:hypothetical protein